MVAVSPAVVGVCGVCGQPVTRSDLVARDGDWVEAGDPGVTVSGWFHSDCLGSDPIRVELQSRLRQSQ